MPNGILNNLGITSEIYINDVSSSPSESLSDNNVFLGICDICDKLTGLDFLNHVRDFHPNVSKLIYMAEKVIETRQQVKIDNAPKKSSGINRLDSIEDL